MSMDGTCRHCERYTIRLRPRGLCHACFKSRRIRRRFGPINTKFLPVDGGDFFGGFKLPTPTEAMPGTEAKIQVLAARVGRREALFHPLDGVRNG